MIIGIRTKKFDKNTQVGGAQKNQFVGGIKKAFKGVTQAFFKPNNTIIRLITDLLKGKVDNSIIGKIPSKINKFKTVIVYILGGGTYQEASEILALKKDYPNINFFYGSSHFSTTYDIIDELENENVMKSLDKKENFDEIFLEEVS